MKPVLLAVTLLAVASAHTHTQIPPVRSLPSPAGSPAWDEHRLTLPIVGPSMAYVPRAPTRKVVLFLSGDGGWNLGVVDMARRIATDTIVVGISLPALVRGTVHAAGCWYPAGDLETIAHAAEKRLGLAEYEPPVLIGYSSGATLVYAALAPAPATTFAGGISLGFCADLDVARPVCKAPGWAPSYDPKKHVSWLPRVSRLPRPWYALHGIQDEVCSPAEARGFIEGIGNAHYVEVPGTGHGFGRPVRWGPAFDEALADVWKAAAPPPKPRPSSPTVATIEQRLERMGLPLEYRWPAGEPSAYVVFFSGDGGWATLDESVATQLASRGIAVVGLSSLRYFWREKTPAQVADTLRGLVAAVGRPVFVGGYSFGAEVISVALRQWSASERAGLGGLVLVGPGLSASFEIDPLDWIRSPVENAATRVAPAVRENMVPALCVVGADEADSACHALENNTSVRVVTLPGSHHFDGNYTAIAERIVVFIASSASAARGGVAAVGL